MDGPPPDHLPAPPLYARVKRTILDRIERGALNPGDRIPTEHALVAETGASRMTVNRALRELADEGRIHRIQGAGSFVAEPKPASDLMELRNIADDIAARGHRHDMRLLTLTERPAQPEEAARLGLRKGAPVFHSVLLHRADARPVQLEDRLVNPLVAPDYPNLDITRETPNAYLTRIAPARAVEHAVEAIACPDTLAEALGLAPGAPCLAVDRRTWVDGAAGPRVASVARLIHPGTRYRLTAGRPPTDRVSPL